MRCILNLMRSVFEFWFIESDDIYFEWDMTQFIFDCGRIV